MSKFTKVLVALLATAAMATPALAIDADFKGFFQARGISYDNLDVTDDSNDRTSGVDQRFRLWTNAALTENVKAVFAIEVDNTWGDTGSGGKEVGKIGADAKGQIEIKHVYLDFNVPEIDTKFTAGTQGWDQGRGYVISDDAAGLKIVKPMPGMNGNLALFWIKTDEGNKAAASQDGDYYSVQADFAAGGWSLVPFYGYWNVDEGAEAHFLGFSADGKAGPLGLAFTVIGNDWDNGESGVAAADGNGIAAYAKASLPVNATTFALEGGYMGDSDGPDGQFVNVSNYNNFSEVLTGGKFDGRGTIGAQAVSDVFMNWIYGKLSAAHKYNDKHSVEAAYIYAQTAEDIELADGTFDKVTFGHEIDAYYNYNIMKGLALTLGGGYLFADDEFAEAVNGPLASADDAWKVGSALTYKF